MIVGPGPGPEPPEAACRALARPTGGSVGTPDPGDEVEVSAGPVDVDSSAGGLPAYKLVSRFVDLLVDLVLLRHQKLVLVVHLLLKLRLN